MHGPTPAGWLLVALCAALGAYCLLRMRSPVDEQRAGAGGEALMGFGMALMAVPAAALTESVALWWVFAVVFGVAAGYEMLRARGSAHHLHHLVGALAMVYMSLAMTSGGGHHSSAGVPLLTGILLVYYAAYVLRSGVRLLPAEPGAVASSGAAAGTAGGMTGAPSGRVSETGWGDRAELATACRLSMGIAMLAMLLTM
ncbi:DUF5134 domain-containing protein [Streptomyces sp. KLOTTS4A1]|uniref:DUF5134 domain-containing protein n=1 Tax=Streptomyces sp. KLOTTS4A1 TaxID=3390996 RepID=UPI0039F48DF3